MQALSVPQPSAWAIARGHKTHLNHAANTGHRGPLAIYASCRAETGDVGNQAIREASGNSADPVAAIGGIVAVVSLEGVCAAGISGRPCNCGKWAFTGSYHWLLADPRPLRLPVLALGQPGLWKLAPAVADAVARMAGMPELAGGPGSPGRSRAPPRALRWAPRSSSFGPPDGGVGWPARAQLDSVHSGTEPLPACTAGRGAGWSGGPATTEEHNQ